MTPRRLALFVQGVPARQPDLKEESKGPRVGAPEGAIAGFLKAAGLASIDRGHDPEGSEEGRLLYRAHREARPRGARRDRRIPAGGAAHVPVAEVDALGRAVGEAGEPRMGAPAARDRRDLRPRERGARDRARSQVDGIRSGNTTYGHRFLAPERDQGAPLRRLRGQRSRRPRSCSIRRGASEIILTRREEPRVRARLRAGRGREPAARRSPAWSNGRWC